MSSLLFGGSSTKPSPSEAATRTACSKLANNAALVVNELAREPAQGLMHVVAHVQRSIPVLLHTHHQLEAAAAQLQAVLSELQDAQEGILSITSPATQQDLAALAHSIDSSIASVHTLQQQQQHQQQHQQHLQQPDAGGGRGGDGGSAGSGGSGASNTSAAQASSSRLRKLFAPGAAGAAAGSSSPTPHV